MRLILLFSLVLSVFSFPVFAQTNIGEVTKRPIPRFASLRGDKVFARTGPATRYPIKWEYTRKNLPVEIIQEFDTWRKIRDVDGEEGWVHQSLLSGKRYAIQNTGQELPLLRDSDDNARRVAMIESGAMMRIDSCENTWCEVSVLGYEGWISAISLWGVYEGERIE